MQTYDSIPNVGAGCDSLYFIRDSQQAVTKIKIPTGCYNIICFGS